MPLRPFGNTVPAIELARFDKWTRIHIQVRDANTIYLGRTRNDLEQPTSGGQQAGLAITQAMGIQSLAWIGSLFLIGSAPQTLVDYEIFPEEGGTGA